MKKTLSIIGLLALLFLIGCSDEEGAPHSAPTGSSELMACIEGQDVDARTAVDDEGNVTWIETDKIGVFGSKTSNAPFTSTGKGGNVAFVGDMASSDDVAEWAYYPYTEDAEVAGGKLTFTLPAEYTYTGNSHAPMIGVKEESNSLSFKHLTGLIRITLGDMPDDADRFVITSAGENAPPLVGKAAVNIQEEDAALRISANGGNSITYTLGNLADGEKFRSFFVPVPVGEYTLLEVSLYGEGETEPYFTRTIPNLNVKRATMIDMPILNGATGERYVLNDNTLEITETMASLVELSETDNTTLIYSDENNLPEVGNVLWSKAQSGFPQGFLGKVTELKVNEDGSVSVSTEPAALSEAFDLLYINEEKIVMLETVPQRAAIDNPFGIELTTFVEGAYKGDDGTYATARVDAGFKCTVYFALDKEAQMEHASVTFETALGYTGTFGATLEGEKDMTHELKSLPLSPILLAGGTVVLTPKLTPKIRTKVEGDIDVKTTISTGLKLVSGAQYSNGAWTKQLTPRLSKTKDAPPIKLETVATFNGTARTGIGLEYWLGLYNLPDLGIGLEAYADLQLLGELELNFSNEPSVEMLKEAKLTSSVLLGGEGTVDASLIVPGEAKAEFTLIEKEFWKQELQLIPFFKDLKGKMTKQKSVSDGGEAVVTTEAIGEVMGDDVQIQYALQNIHTGEVEQVSDPVAYIDGTDNEITEEEEHAQTTVPQEIKFENLDEETVYQVYPIVVTSLLQGYNEGKVELKDQAVSLSSEREILEAFYKATGGENWKNNENWCTDKPLDEWYGVELSTNTNQGAMHLLGKVRSISLDDNGLTGNADLSGLPAMWVLHLGNNPQLTSLDVSDCEGLVALYCNNSGLTSLDLSNCGVLRTLECQNNKLTSLDLSTCNYLTNATLDNNKLATLEVYHGSGLEMLSCNDNLLTEMDLSGCTSLRNVVCNRNLLTGLDISSCTSLNYLMLTENNELEELTLTQTSLSGIVLSNCLNLKELNVSNNSKLTDLDVSGCSNLRTLKFNNGQLRYPNLSGCTSLTTLDCSNNVDFEQFDVSMFLGLTALYCQNTRIRSEIPTAFYNITFSYDQRYSYSKSENSEVEWIDRGYGWWYPGEPEKGYHGR